MRFENSWYSKNIIPYVLRKSTLSILISFLFSIGMVANCRDPHVYKGRHRGLINFVNDAINGMPYMKWIDILWVLFVFALFSSLSIWAYSYYQNKLRLIAAIDIDEARRTVTFTLKSPFNRKIKKTLHFRGLRVNTERWEDIFITKNPVRCVYITYNKMIVGKYFIHPEIWPDETALNELRKVLEDA